jgi:hypothetical protein
MTTKTAFNADEWSTITSAPVLTGMLVIAADRGGTVRETLSISRAYASAREAQPSQLLQQILSSPPALNASSVRGTAGNLRDEAPAKLREAVDLLELKATDAEVVEYKRFVYGLADAVARAHREGGFLGIGGTEVSENEQAALDKIAAIFDAPVSRRAQADDAEPAPRTSFTTDEAREVGESIGIDWDAAPFDVEQFRMGMDVELEHGQHDPRTNVTGDDPALTGKIAWAHLKELADYYTRLQRMESEAGS